MDYGHRYADKKISAVDRELKTTYRKAQKELKEKLRDFNEQFSEKNREQKAKLKNGDITKEEYQSWLAGKVFVRSRWQEQIRMINAVLLDHNRQALNIVNTSRFDVFAENYNFNSYLAEKKMVGMFNLYNAEAVARLLVDDPKLLPEWKIDQKKDYVWNQQKVNNAIRQGIIQGKSVDEITADLTSGLCAKNAARMRMFARTAITGAENAGRQQQMKDAAEMGIEQEKEWDAVHDSVTRDAHRALDGQRVPWDQPFRSPLGDIMFPGDPSASMANVANCRCTMKTIYPKYDHSKPRGEGETIDGQSYEEWKKGKQKRGEVAPQTVSNKSSIVVTTIKGKEITLKRAEVSDYPFPDGNWQGVKQRGKAIEYTLPDGMKFYFKDGMSKENQGLTPTMLARAYYDVPEEVRTRGQKSIVVVDYKNPEDGYWAKRFKWKDFTSYMTGGDTIDIWKHGEHKHSYLVESLAHEMGHKIDRDNNDISTKTEWKKAKTADKKVSGMTSPRSYGDKNNAEDFAVSIEKYVKDKNMMERDFPNRTAVIKRLLGVK